jgi:hypothetical protein
MNYALDTPVKRNLWIPPVPKDTPVEKHSGQETQDHRVMTWLHHKPQAHAIFPLEAQSGRKK